MEILGEKFGKKFRKGKKSDMDFVKMDISKVRRFQEELVVDVRNMKGMIQNITETMELLQTKYKTTQDNLNMCENNKNETGNIVDEKIVNNVFNTSSEIKKPLETPKISISPYPKTDNKEFQHVKKKMKKSKGTSSDSESETNFASSGNSSDDSKRHGNRRRKGGHKGKNGKQRGGNKSKKSEALSDHDSSMEDLRYKNHISSDLQR